MSDSVKIKQGDRLYNGIPSKLMNDIYDQLIARYGSLEQLEANCGNWSLLSLYLSRSCGVIERRKNETRTRD